MDVVKRGRGRPRKEVVVVPKRGRGRPPKTAEVVPKRGRPPKTTQELVPLGSDTEVITVKEWDDPQERIEKMQKQQSSESEDMPQALRTTVNSLPFMYLAALIIAWYTTWDPRLDQDKMLVYTFSFSVNLAAVMTLLLFVVCLLWNALGTNQLSIAKPILFLAWLWLCMILGNFVLTSFAYLFTFSLQVQGVAADTGGSAVQLLFDQRIVRPNANSGFFGPLFDTASDATLGLGGLLASIDFVYAFLFNRKCDMSWGKDSIPRLQAVDRVAMRYENNVMAKIEWVIEKAAFESTGWNPSRTETATGCAAMNVARFANFWMGIRPADWAFQYIMEWCLPDLANPDSQFKENNGIFDFSFFTDNGLACSQTDLRDFSDYLLAGGDGKDSRWADNLSRSAFTRTFNGVKDKSVREEMMKTLFPDGFDKEPKYKSVAAKFEVLKQNFPAFEIEDQKSDEWIRAKEDLFYDRDTLLTKGGLAFENAGFDLTEVYNSKNTGELSPELLKSMAKNERKIDNAITRFPQKPTCREKRRGCCSSPAEPDYVSPGDTLVYDIDQWKVMYI